MCRVFKLEIIESKEELEEQIKREKMYANGNVCNFCIGIRQVRRRRAKP